MFTVLWNMELGFWDLPPDSDHKPWIKFNFNTQWLKHEVADRVTKQRTLSCFPLSQKGRGSFTGPGVDLCVCASESSCTVMFSNTYRSCLLKADLNASIPLCTCSCSFWVSQWTAGSQQQPKNDCRLCFLIKTITPVKHTKLLTASLVALGLFNAAWHSCGLPVVFCNGVRPQGPCTSWRHRF